MQDKSTITGLQVGRPDPLIGCLIGGKYEIVQLVGRGGWSHVYQAKHQVLASPVAIKMLDAGFAPSAEMLQRFDREAQALSALNHPNVVFVFDYGLTPGPYFVMEMLEGKTLGESLKQAGPMPWKAATAVFQQLCDGLAAAHGKGIVHRDIKPGNIMLCDAEGDTPLVKILDFGIAKLALGEESETLTATEQTLGSPPYMSPEQCLKDPLDARSDIYSLGCVMFETLTGKQAFYGRSQMEVMHKHILGQAPEMVAPARGLRFPAALEDVVMKCLAVAPADRYPSAQALKNDLSRVLSGGKQANPTGFRQPHQLRRLSKRIWRSLAVTISLAVAVLLGTVWQQPLLNNLWQWCYGIGLSRMAQHDYKQAAGIFQAARVLSDQLVPADRRSLQTQIKLAEALYLGGNEKASQSIVRAVRALKAANSDEQLSRAIDKAQALMSEKDYLQAEPILAAVLKVASANGVGRNLLAAQCLAGLTGVYLATDRLDRAEAAGRKALSLREQLLDPDDVHLAYSYNDLGAVLNLEGRLGESRPLLDSALSIASNHQLGMDVLHLDEGDDMYRRGADAMLVAAIHNNLATAASNAGQRFAAERAVKDDLDNLNQANGSYLRTRSLTLATLARIYGDTDRLDAADKMFQQAVEIEGSRPHLDTIAYILYHWGRLRIKQNRLPEAADLMKRSLSYARGVTPQAGAFMAMVAADLTKLLPEGSLTGQQFPQDAVIGNAHPDDWRRAVKQAGFLIVNANQADNLAAHKDLDELDCQDPRATDADLAQIGLLKKLWAVTLNNTAITGATLKELSQLPDLALLSLETRHVDDQAIADLQSASLHTLSLNHSGIASAGANSIAQNCPNLAALGMDDTMVDDRCLPRLARMRHLRFLNVSSTRVTEAGLLALTRSPGLILLKLSGWTVHPQVRARLTEAGIIVLDDKWYAEHPCSDRPGNSWQDPILHICLNPAGLADIRGH